MGNPLTGRLSFHMMYWMIYLTISGEVPDDIVPLND